MLTGEEKKVVDELKTSLMNFMVLVNLKQNKALQTGELTLNPQTRSGFNPESANMCIGLMADCYKIRFGLEQFSERMTTSVERKTV